MRNNFSTRFLIETLLILVSLGVIYWAIHLLVDYKNALKRDIQRIAMIKPVQAALERYHQDHGSYPGIDNFFWGSLTKDPKVAPYYDFSSFQDPCQPSKPVPFEGGIECPNQMVTYLYRGIDCEQGCKGYKFVIKLEHGGEAVIVHE